MKSTENTLGKSGYSPKTDGLPILISQGIKQHVCDVLEGGDEAFMKREKKYVACIWFYTGRARSG